MKEAFQHTDSPGLLTMLFYTLGSFQALATLKTACQAVRQHPSQATFSSRTVADTMNSLDRLEGSMRVNSLLRKYHLVCLVEFQDQLQASLPDLVHNPRHIKPVTRAQAEILRLSNPDVPGPEEGVPASDAFLDLQKKLQKRVSRGRKWLQFTRRFGIAVLALVPTGADVAYSDNE